MKVIIILVLFLMMMVLSQFVPKRDYSHVPKQYRNLVHFAESGGL